MEKAQLESWPDEGLEDVESCPVCRSKDFEMLYEGIVDKIFRSAPGQWNIQGCVHCRSAFLNPRPTASSIHLAYRNYYTHEDSARVSHEDMGAARRWLRAIANGYRNHRYGTKLQPASRLGIVAGWVSPRLRRTVRDEFRNLPSPGAGKRLLDVGFGNGAFLENARSAGWQIAGADPDEEVIRRAKAKGLPVRQGGVETWSDEPVSFDYVTLSHVIEHVHDPRTVLDQVRRLLKPGGTIWLETPNIESYGHHRFREAWRGLEVPRHLVLFNEDSLARLMRESGFTSVTRIRGGSNYANNALKSLAIKHNRDPYGDLGSLPWNERVYAWMVRVYLMVSQKRSEFITVTAERV